jgi:lipoprotein signal peptidase
VSVDMMAESAATIERARSWRAEPGRRPVLVALLAGIIVLDQVTKWWAWRNAHAAVINSGGTPFAGATVDRWYEAPVSGALLDVLGFGLLATSLSVLARGRTPVLVSVSGAIMIGGWISNLLDRLGVHHWTAPGSARGAVDFLSFGSVYWNVADLFIMVGTSLFVLALLCLRCWRHVGVRRPMAWGPGTGEGDLERRRGSRRWHRIVGAVTLVCLVSVNAANSDGLTASIYSASGVNKS